MAPPLADPGLDMSLASKLGGDEIDWEIVGGRPYQAESNLFYRGLPEYGVRGGVHEILDVVDVFHKYTIDWKHKNITFLVDDKMVRVYSIDDPLTNSQYYPGRKFFPDRPAKIQFAV
jgi:beta-glucanase (GH16 family)